MAITKPERVGELAATSAQKIQPQGCYESPKKPATSSSDRAITQRVEALTTILKAELKPVLGIYCVDFASRFGAHTETIMREYAEQLIAHRMTRVGLQRGIERLKARAADNRFTPNPREFAQMCKPTAEELGIPDLDTATYEVRQARGRWRTSTTSYPFTHRLVELLNERVGVDIYHCSENEWRKRVKAEYERLLRLAMDNMLPPKREALTQTIADERPPFERFGGRLVRHDEVRSIIDSCKRKFHSDTNTPST